MNIKQLHGIHSAAYLLLEKNGKFLMMRRYNTGFYDGLYCFAVGKVDGGEACSASVIREAAEELGILIKSEDVECVHITHRLNALPGYTHQEWFDVFFKARAWQGEIINKEPHKCDDISWFDLDALPENIIPYLKKAIEHIRKGRFYSEHGWK